MTFGAGTTQERKNDLTRQAVAMAMDNRWAEAVEVNRAILDDFPNDLETCNRLGKALSELGRNGEARNAFERALSLSPHNPIAKKNLDRLSKLGDEVRSAGAPAVRSRRAFIEESGKSGVTSLINLAPAERLLELAPGHPLELDVAGGALKVSSQSGEYLGQVEPRLAARLVRLTRGGNRYEAIVTGVEERSLSVFIRETFRHPSQAGTVSFPSPEGPVDAGARHERLPPESSRARRRPSRTGRTTIRSPGTTRCSIRSCTASSTRTKRPSRTLAGGGRTVVLSNAKDLGRGRLVSSPLVALFVGALQRKLPEVEPPLSHRLLHGGLVRGGDLLEEPRERVGGQHLIGAHPAPLRADDV